MRQKNSELDHKTIQRPLYQVREEEKSRTEVRVLMDMSRKSLGNEWDHPQDCESCGILMSVNGWERYENKIHCLACGSIYEWERVC